MPHPFPNGSRGRPPEAAGRSVWRSILILCAAAVCFEAAAHPPMDGRIRDLEERILADPDNPRLYLRRAAWYISMAHWEAARADLESCRRLDPDLVAADFQLGRLWIEAGEPALALPALDRYLLHLPGDAAALALRARAGLELGLDLQAAADFARAIDARRRAGHGTPPEWYLARARAMAAAGPEHLPEALGGLDAGIRDLGEPITLHLEALDLEIRLGRIEAALTRIDRLIEASPWPASWWVRRGEVLAAAGRCDEAIDPLARAGAAIDALPEARRSAGAFLDLADRVRILRAGCAADAPDTTRGGEEGG